MKRLIATLVNACLIRAEKTGDIVFCQYESMHQLVEVRCYEGGYKGSPTWEGDVWLKDENASEKLKSLIARVMDFQPEEVAA